MNGKLLTKQQTQVLEYASEGLTEKETAEKLNLSYKTVKYHKTRIFKNLKVKTIIQAINIFNEYKIHGTISIEKPPGYRVQRYLIAESEAKELRLKQVALEYELKIIKDKYDKLNDMYQKNSGLLPLSRS